MKILCVCRGGNVRSVAAKMILRRYFGHETLACGWENNDWVTIGFLANWADKVIVMHKDFVAMLPAHIQSRAEVLHVGEDIWGNPFNEELQLRIFDLIQFFPILRNGKNPDRDAVARKLREYQDKIALRNLCDETV